MIEYMFSSSDLKVLSTRKHRSGGSRSPTSSGLERSSWATMTSCTTLWCLAIRCSMWKTRSSWSIWDQWNSWVSLWIHYKNLLAGMVPLLATHSAVFYPHFELSCLRKSPTFSAHPIWYTKWGLSPPFWALSFEKVGKIPPPPRALPLSHSCQTLKVIDPSIMITTWKTHSSWSILGWSSWLSCHYALQKFLAWERTTVSYTQSGVWHPHFELSRLRKSPKLSALPCFGTIVLMPDSEGYKPKHNDNNMEDPFKLEYLRPMKLMGESLNPLNKSLGWEGTTAWYTQWGLTPPVWALSFEKVTKIFCPHPFDTQSGVWHPHFELSRLRKLPTFSAHPIWYTKWGLDTHILSFLVWESWQNCLPPALAPSRLCQTPKFINPSIMITTAVVLCNSINKLLSDGPVLSIMVQDQLVRICLEG